MTQHQGLSKPPEGAVVGEDVPVENTNAEHELEDALVERCMGLLKARGAPYTAFSDAELREKAREVLGMEV